MRPGNKAWAVLGLGVCAYDYLAPPGETMSESVDRAIEKHPVATIVAIGAVTLHLLNVYEHYHLERLDPIHIVASRLRGQKEL